jgi:hypothetical protein
MLLLPICCCHSACGELRRQSVCFAVCRELVHLCRTAAGDHVLPGMHSCSPRMVREMPSMRMGSSTCSTNHLLLGWCVELQVGGVAEVRPSRGSHFGVEESSLCHWRLCGHTGRYISVGCRYYGCCYARSGRCWFPVPCCLLFLVALG